MVIITICSILLLIVSSALIVNHLENRVRIEKEKISIKESIDLAQVPIITLKNGNIKLNFLLDTGSSNSHISSKGAKKIEGTPMKVDYSYTTALGSDNGVSSVIEATLTYKNRSFKSSLLINKNLDASFEEVKKNCGIQVHGILGSDFLTEHKYVLDFAELVAYNKK